MEINNKTISSDEEITLANTSLSGKQIIGDIDPYFDDTIALLDTDKIHEKIMFDSTYTFIKSYTVTGEAVSLYLDTDETLAHEGGKDGAYSFKFSSPDTQLSCEFIDTDDWTSVGKNHGDSVNLAMLLPDKKLFKIRIEPDEHYKPVTIDVEITYTIYRNIGQINVEHLNKSIAVRKNDRFMLHFRNSIEKDCTWSSSNPSVISVGHTSGQLTAHQLGSATITFTNPCGTSYSTVVRCVLDHVYITPDGTGYNKVAFSTSGRIWHCVYRDTIFESPQNIADATYKRNNLNYYYGFDVDENMPTSIINKFSEEELSLLYFIDPFGVANYIKIYTDNINANENILDFLGEYKTDDTEENRIRAQLVYKDDIFKTIFGRNPKYFKYNELAEKWYPTISWYTSNEKITGKYIVSESESIFGFHSFITEASAFEILFIILDIALEIAVQVVKIQNIAIGEVLDKTKDYISFIIMSITSIDIFKDLTIYDAELILKRALEKHKLEWIYDLTNLFKDVNTINKDLESMNIDPHHIKLLINECVNKKFYDINIESEAGKNGNLYEIAKKLV